MAAGAGTGTGRVGAVAQADRATVSTRRVRRVRRLVESVIDPSYWANRAGANRPPLTSALEGPTIALTLRRAQVRISIFGVRNRALGCTLREERRNEHMSALYDAIQRVDVLLKEAGKEKKEFFQAKGQIFDAGRVRALDHPREGSRGPHQARRSQSRSEGRARQEPLVASRLGDAMRSLSIRAKVVGLMLLGVGTVTLAVGMSVAGAFEQNKQTMARESLKNAQASFSSLVRDDLGKLGATGEALLAIPGLVESFAARDRARLLAEAQRVYPQLVKEYGITHLNFIGPDRHIFLRMTKPEQFDDLVERVTLANAMKTNAFSAGLELGKTGFVLRTVRPIMTPAGPIGYLELGEEIGSFAGRLKAQTGFDLGLLLEKKRLKKEDWAHTRAALRLPDNWDERPEVVVAQSTTSDEQLLAFRGDVDSIPSDGLVLEQLRTNGKVLMRGLFKIADASGASVGAVFVLTDISQVSQAVESARLRALLMAVALVILLSIAMWLVLERLVFRRLSAMGARLEELSLRVAGGDFDIDTGIPTAGAKGDEIGRLEQFLAQFLVLIGGTLKSLVSAAKEPKD